MARDSRRSIKSHDQILWSGRAGEGHAELYLKAKQEVWLLTIVQVSPRNGSITGDLLRMGAWISTLPGQENLEGHR